MSRNNKDKQEMNEIKTERTMCRIDQWVGSLKMS